MSLAALWRWFVAEEASGYSPRRCSVVDLQARVAVLGAWSGSDLVDDLVEGGCDTQPGSPVRAEFVVAAAKVLHTGRLVS
jgi:hypothetical protein